MRWSSDNGSLAAIADGSLVIWYYPEAVFVDRDVLPATISRQPCSDVGKSSEILDFVGTRATIRRSDGAIVTYAGSPYPAMVERFANAKEWESALRLCRYVKSPVSQQPCLSSPFQPALSFPPDVRSLAFLLLCLLRQRCLPHRQA
eukprot:scaffold166732_cov27-Tisochrysis_lutea.AAC.2